MDCNKCRVRQFVFVWSRRALLVLLLVGSIVLLHNYKSEPLRDAVAVALTSHRTLSSFEAREIHCLAHNIHFESEGEPALGQEGVAWVTINRRNDKRWPSTVCNVVRQVYLHRNKKGKVYRVTAAFSWTRDGKSDFIKSRRTYENALLLAVKVYFTPEVPEIWRGVYNFIAFEKVSPKLFESWTKHYDLRVVVGNHAFFKVKKFKKARKKKKRCHNKCRRRQLARRN